jgi:hypothetical protein
MDHHTQTHAPRSLSPMQETPKPFMNEMSALLSPLPSPKQILHLQRTIGNAAVKRMFATSSARSRPHIQRMTHANAPVNTQVKFTRMVVLAGNRWIEPGTLAKVTQAAAIGDIKVKILTRDYAGDVVDIDPADLELSPLGDLPEEFLNEQDVTKQNLLKNKMEATTLLTQNSALLGGALNEVKQSILHPELIDQGQFNFCGPNDFLMAIALRDPVAYARYIIDLYTAKAAFDQGNMAPQTAHLGNMNVNVDPGVTGAQANAFDQANAQTTISQTGWMAMGSIRTQATNQAPDYSNDPTVINILQAFQGGGIPAAFALQPTSADLQKAIMVIKQQTHQQGNTLQANALIPNQSAVNTPDLEDLRKITEGASPAEVASWFTQFGAANIVQNADPFATNKTAGDLQTVNNELAGGKMVMININTDTLQGNAWNLHQPDLTKSHWVLMKTPFVQGPQKWKAQVYSWGQERTIKIIAGPAYIRNSFFGYVSATIATPQSNFQF